MRHRFDGTFIVLLLVVRTNVPRKKSFGRGEKANIFTIIVNFYDILVFNFHGEIKVPWNESVYDFLFALTLAAVGRRQ
jgi:hypothetical protein